MKAAAHRQSLGTSQDPFKLVGGMVQNTGGALGAVATYSYVLTIPTILLNGAAAAPGRVVAGCDQATLAQLKFVAGDADGEAFTAFVWGGKYLSTSDDIKDATLTPLLDLALTAGSTPWPDASRVMTEEAGVPLFLVDTIAVTNDYTRNNSAQVWGELANAWGVIDFDAGGAAFLMIEMLLGTANRAGVLHADF